MVSSACRGQCSTMPPKSSSRVLSLDLSKDYSLPLQVETSVEYDLPSHIYPPKGSEPILMIHPGYSTPVRSRKVTVTLSQSPSVLSSPSVNSKPLSTLQVHSNQQLLSRSASKTKCWCACGNPNCVSRSSSSSRSVSGVRNSQEQLVLTSKQSSHNIPENIVYNMKNNINNSSVDMKLQQLKTASQKQAQATQKQLQLQQHQQQQLQQAQLQQMQERAKLQVQLQQQQLQSQQQKSQQKATASVPRQPTNSDQLLSSWTVSGRCHLPCCQPRVGALPTTSEFLAPGLPPSLLTRTPVRGPAAGSSPKLRARARRLLNVSNTVNVPEYLSVTRSCRTSSAGTSAVGSSHGHTRTRSSSMLSSTPAPITAHQVASALDVVRSHVLTTPRSLYASSQQQQTQQQQQQQQQQLQCNINSSTSSLLSTVGQSRDSGCSLSTEVINTSTNNFTTSCENPTKSVEWNWSVVDSGFCTPVDINDDQLMETYEATPVTSTVSHYIGKDSSSNSSSNSSNSSSSSSLSSSNWIREFTTPINSSSSSSSMTSIHSSFLASTPTHNHHYMPQPIWNLAY